MADFSQRDLLILSNYVYFSCSTYETDRCIGDTLKRFKNESGEYDLNKLYSQGAISCNISEEEAIELFKRIENDEKLSRLHVSRKLDNNDLRAVCFANEDESNACVIFRGTGGTYDAWYDNVTGEYEKDTKLQKLAADFIKNDCGQYENLTVSGHSKGGNLAQYVTVVCGTQVDECISFDGQGFSKSFIKEYSKEIEGAKDKITSIAAYNDYVNILLTAIASKRIFLKNDGTDIDGHSSATLLNSILFNEDGSIDMNSSKTLQGLPAWMLEKSLDNMVNIIDLLPGDGAKKASNIIAAAVASLMSNNMTEEYEKRQFCDALKTFGSYASNITDLLVLDPSEVNITFINNYANCSEINRACCIIYDSSSEVLKIVERAEEVLRGLDYSITGRIYTESALLKVIEKLIRIRNKINNNAEIIRKICVIYSNDEKELLNTVNNVVG